LDFPKVENDFLNLLVLVGAILKLEIRGFQVTLGSNERLSPIVVQN